MVSDVQQFGFGVCAFSGNIFLYYAAQSEEGRSLSVDLSRNGYEFVKFPGTPAVTDRDGMLVDVDSISNMRVTKADKDYFMTCSNRSTGDVESAISKDLLNWRVVGALTANRGGNIELIKGPAAVVPDLKIRGHRVMYFGDGDISVAVTKDLIGWKAGKNPVLSPRQGKFDEGPLTVAGAYRTDKGIALLYYSRKVENGISVWAIGTALFDGNAPEKLLYRGDEPIVEHLEGFGGKNVTPVGVIQLEDALMSYWDVENEGIVAVSHPVKRGERPKMTRLQMVLNRVKENPILRPVAGHAWESKAVFNPAAIYENGKVHLIYRAVGDNDVSVLGYATSDDGVNFDTRHAEPIYVPRADFEGLHTSSGSGGYLSPFFSGGAYGGVEDPRISKVEDKYVMTYVAYDGANPPRVALTSIPVDEFHTHNWDTWAQPVLISAPGVVNKNACVFPEKIDGKYVIFHRIYPHILVDYVDDLKFDGKTKFLQGQYSISPRDGYWDSRKIGVGAPPIRTEYGWLLIYQSVGEQDPGRYKMGAMILDARRPERVLYRSKTPLLAPDVWYENEGLKAGVAYPCGSVIKDGKLMVYYGGADTVICAAQADSEEFLYNLTHYEQAQLNMVKIKPRWG